MIKNISEKFVSYIADDTCSDEQLEEMKYVTRLILYELMKTIGVLLIFSLTGYLKEALIIWLVTCFTRPYIGGYHEETQINCFITSILFTAVEILLNKQCNISFLANCILLIICIFAIYNQAPIINPKMPITRSELIYRNRVNGIRNSIIVSLISIILYNYTSMYSLITWPLLIEVLFMFNKRKM